jgi:HPt (histidine-containing phosphotransfer) domain-containing protein
VQKGIEMTGGKDAGYRTVLSMFCKDTRDRIRLLAGAATIFSGAEVPAFVTQVHALKSASASIGAAELSEKAAALEAAGKAGDTVFIKENIEGFLLRLEKTVKDIGEALGTAAVSSSEDSSPGSTGAFPAQLLRELEAALKSQNAGDIDRIMAELSEYPMDAKTKAAVEQISDQVLMAEFDEAAAGVQELLAGNE